MPATFQVGNINVNGTLSGDGSGLTDIPVAALDTTGASLDNVVTFNGTTAVWSAPTGGGGDIVYNTTPTNCTGMLYGTGSVVLSDGNITTGGSGDLSVTTITASGQVRGGSLWSDGAQFTTDGSGNVTAASASISGGVGCDSVSATVISTGFLRCGNTDNTDPTSQPVVGRMPIYDGGGSILGYLPIYSV